jgi:hypothetical protein
MPAEVARTGGCLCRAVRYEVRGPPYVSGLCHCTTCRKLTGSAFSATANWHRTEFQMVGELQTYERRQFCPKCGSRLFFLSDEDVEIFLGTLDVTPNGIVPTQEIWTIRREHWLWPVSEAAQFDESPLGR